jgi:hypothetical protein
MIATKRNGALVIAAEPDCDALDAVWIAVDKHPAVRRRDNPRGVLSRDQAYALAQSGRVRALWVSRRRLLLHRDLLDDLARAGPLK